MLNIMSEWNLLELLQQAFPVNPLEALDELRIRNEQKSEVVRSDCEDDS